MSNHVLTFGALNLNGGTGDGYTINALADDADFGEPQPIEVGIRSLLQDGSIAQTLGHDNAEAFFRIVIEGDDSAGMEAGRAALVAEVGKPNLLTWEHPDGMSPARVYEIHTSSLAPVFDDLDEFKLNRMVFGLRLVRMPWARAEATTVIPALTSAGSLTTTLVDACSSAAGWAQTGGTTFGVVSGAVQVSRVTGTSGDMTLTRTSTAINMTSSPYLTLRIGYSGVIRPVGSNLIRVYADGVLLEQVYVTQVSRSGLGVDATVVEDLTFYCPDTSITTIKVEATYSSSAATPYLNVDNVNRLNQVPFTGTARQKARTLTIGGSVRTPGSLSIKHASSPLGEVLCYVHEETYSGYKPNLRDRRISGGTVTADTSLVSGSREDIVTQVGFEIPVLSLPPGPYVLMARVAAITTTTTRTVTWNTEAHAGGAAWIYQTGTARLPFTTAGVYEIHVIAHMVLPTMAVSDNSTGTMRLYLQSSGGLNLDEAWLFDTKRGALVWADCFSSGPVQLNNLWIDSPTIENPRPSVFVGDQSDKSDGRYPTVLKSWQMPTFNPGITNVFTVTTGALDADVAFEHYERLG